MPPLHVVFPNNAKAERTRKGWDQLQFGRAIGGWSRSKVSEFETHRIRVAVEELAPVCRALGKTLAELAENCDPDDLAALGL